MNGTVLKTIAVGAPYSDARLEQNLNAWMQEYQKQLAAVVQEFPEQYAYPVEQVLNVCARMREAFRKDSYNIDSHAIKRTCKAFGIKHTRKAIREALTNGQA